MQKTEEYTFKRLNEYNLKDLVALFLSSNKRGVSHKKFVKKYDTNYTGVKAIGYLAYYNDNIPVAFYGVIPCLAKVNNQIIKIAQATDGLTNLKHQHKGLFSKLVLMTYKWAEEEGIQFIYGIPNDKSFSAYMNKLNWKHSGNMLIYKWWVKTLPLSYFFKRFPKFHPIYRLYINFILFFYKKASYFPNPNINESFFGIYRNIEYFKYKEYQKKQNIKINEMAVWLSIDGILKIGDMEKPSLFDYNKTVRKIKRLAFILGTNKIVMQYSPNSYWSNILNQYHKPEIGLPIIYLSLTNTVNPEKFVFSYSDIDTF